jgi:hypothetical protein
MSDTNEFDPSLNLDYHTKYDNQSSAVSDVLGGVAATAVDFGASVWNSLPGTTNVDTADLLRGVSDNALRVYEEHPDTIHTASFIGGMFIPSTLAFKGMNLARTGMKGVNWFSKAGREADLAKVEQFFSEGQAATKAYRQAKTEYFLKGVANQALDAVAMEGAIVATMNAHPLMEDYMADPVKNFAIGAAFGGVLGSGLGLVSDAHLLRNLTGGVESKAYQDVFKAVTTDEGAFKTAYKSTQNATQLQIQQANIDSLQKIIDSTDATYNGLTKSVAEKISLGLKQDQVQRFEDMLSPELKSMFSVAGGGQLSPEIAALKGEMLNTFVNNPAMAGVDAVSYLTQVVEGEANAIKHVGNVLVNNPIFKILTNKQTGEKAFDDVAYFPEFDRFANVKDAKHYTRARDLGMSLLS